MHTEHHPGLSQVVGDIYDAAIDPSLWSDVIVKIVDLVGGQAGSLAIKDFDA